MSENFAKPRCRGQKSANQGPDINCGGAVQPIAVALISESFASDDAKRDNYIGYFQGIGAFMTMAITLIAGFLCVYSWQSVFWVYYISIPALTFIILFVPSPKPPFNKAAWQKPNSVIFHKGHSSLLSEPWAT